MPVTELLLEGLRLMLIGMGIVFVFLLMLVAVLRMMSAFTKRVGAEAQAPQSLATFGGPEYEGRPDQGELLAVITAAVTRYRRDRRRP